MAQANTMKIKLVRSLAGVKKDQIAVLESLGLRKIGDISEQPANAATEGKAFKVSHLIEVIER